MITIPDKNGKGPREGSYEKKKGGKGKGKGTC